MASFNKVIILGNLTREPKLEYTPKHTAVVDFGIATNRRWTGANGEKKSEVCYMNCKAFGSLANNINKYCGKGKPLLVEGRLKFEKWASADQKTHNKLYIVVENFSFVSSDVNKTTPDDVDIDSDSDPEIEQTADNHDDIWF